MSLLHGTAVDPEVLRATRQALSGPATTTCVTDIDPGGSLARNLGVDACDVWIIRPDAHVAAALRAPTSASLIAAIRAALGFDTTGLHGADTVGANIAGVNIAGANTRA
jgi:pentachlorophenol monooxygenase/3-(3-hydroxy-phenyl)propionate hydroxylase